MCKHLPPGLSQQINHQIRQISFLQNMPSLIYRLWTAQPSLFNLQVSTQTFSDCSSHRDLPSLHCCKHVFLFFFSHIPWHFIICYKRSLFITTYHLILLPYAFYSYMCLTHFPYKIRTPLKVRALS